MIPYGRQIIDEEDLEAVRKVLQSPFITQGPTIAEFEKSVTHHCMAKHGVAVNSATSALHIACLALDLGPGDLLWTTPISFVASANCGRYCGADVDFVDIDPATWNLSPAALQRKLERASKAGRLPKVLVAVHLTGQSCEMDKIKAHCDHYGVRVIEDASHAIGASYQNLPVGDCRHCDICIFSFHPVKIITTGEGGMAVTNNADLAARMQLYRSHGITREPHLMHQQNAPAWYYEQQQLGYNYRITDIQAALGVSQMNKLEHFVDSRRELAEWYTDKLDDLPLLLPHEISTSRSAFHLYVIGLDEKSTLADRDVVFKELRKRGLGVNLHYWPIHLQPYYRNLGFAEGDFPVAEAYGKRSISIPMFAEMPDAVRKEVVATLRDVIR